MAGASSVKNKSKAFPKKPRLAGKRLDPDIFGLPVEKIRNGYYADKYFNRTKYILEQDNNHAEILMQIFQKRDSVLCGIDQAVAILKKCTGYYDKQGNWIDCWDRLEVKALYDGDRVKPYETVMTIAGNYSLFAHLETVYLGAMARGTMIATNTNAVVEAANGKPVLFFPARFDLYHNDPADGYAAYISDAFGVSTDAQGAWWGGEGLGTIPHALIAAYKGDTAKSAEKFAQYIDPSVNVIALVDFHNDCVNDALQCARTLGKKLWGVRLDNSSTVVDKALWEEMGNYKPTGVNPQLAFKVRKALDEEGFDWVKIIVSGGFNPEKIRKFENVKAPVDVYAVGSAIIEGTFDFTADVVLIKDKGKWVDCAKFGRGYRPNDLMVKVK